MKIQTVCDQKNVHALSMTNRQTGRHKEVSTTQSLTATIVEIRQRSWMAPLESDLHSTTNINGSIDIFS